MPFGLTNVPATFQATMNAAFENFLRKFVVIFFDDILVYSTNLQDHIEHLRAVFTVLKKNELLVKLSKCRFGQTSVGFLGHIISGGGVNPNLEKLRAMEEWPIPKTIKQLRGFLGLTGYYRRFIEGYAKIAAPMTELLKKNAFCWCEAEQISFETLKASMLVAPVLAFPDFDKQFVVETDACSIGIGAVLS